MVTNAVRVTPACHRPQTWRSLIVGACVVTAAIGCSAHAAAAQSSDVNRPVTRIASPVQSEMLMVTAGDPVKLNGTAADPRGIERTELAFRNVATGKWLR